MESWHVFLVDDEKDIREVVQEYLEAFGHRVDALASGKEALDRLAEQRRPYDIALIDWKMPGIPGSAVIQDLARRAPEVPILVSTGLVEHVSLPLVPSPLGIIRKPFSLRELVREMRRMLDNQPNRPS